MTDGGRRQIIMRQGDAARSSQIDLVATSGGGLKLLSGFQIDAAHDDAGRSAFKFPRQELARRARFYSVAQPLKLLLALVGGRPPHVLQLIHGRRADGAAYFLAPVHHGEQEHHRSSS